jgi:hypothetical protein
VAAPVLSAAHHGVRRAKPLQCSNIPPPARKLTQTDGVDACIY